MFFFLLLFQQLECIFIDIKSSGNVSIVHAFALADEYLKQLTIPVVSESPTAPGMLSAILSIKDSRCIPSNSKKLLKISCPGYFHSVI